MSRLPARLAALACALLLAATVPASAACCTGPTHLTDAQRATLLTLRRGHLGVLRRDDR